MDRYVTRDSGRRIEYSTGMVRDVNDDKPAFDLILPEALDFDEQMLTRWANLMTRGAKKYGIRNWEKARTWKEWARFRGSALRHFMQWYTGMDDEDHAAACFFNITAAEY